MAFFKARRWLRIKAQPKIGVGLMRKRKRKS